MSKASEWAETCLKMEPPPFQATEARDSISIRAYVESDLACVIVKAAPVDTATIFLQPTTALGLARWILDTFGEDPA